MPVLMPPQEYLADPLKLLALCIWREARGESLQAKCGVAATVMNRCKAAPREGFKPDVAGNVLKPWAFSSFMAGDPNSVKLPKPDDPAWLECLEAAKSADDPTGGAVFYFSRPLTAPPKAWGDVAHSVTIGGMHFYRLSMAFA